MRQTKSLCPECLSILDASIYEEDNKIMIEKTCKEHGTVKDIYWSDSYQYNRFDKYRYNGNGVDNPNIIKSEKSCPNSCGLCSSHKTSTILANIDVTNRCNLHCPTCFANASNNEHIYEPSMGQIRKMMGILRDQKPLPCPGIQFSGGEPTIRNDIIEIIKMARDFEFGQIQIATNGIRLANDLQFCNLLENSGLNTVYLQFDGVTREPYIKNRGSNILPLKLKAIDNCRKSGLTSVNLVPTLAKGINDNQVGDIIKFAANNIDVIKGINFQPISFSGRINKNGKTAANERMEKRITIPDLFNLIEEQTNGDINGDDFYPVPSTVPVSQFLTQNGQPSVEFSVHPHCGAGTFVYVDKETKKMTPVTRFVDTDGLFEYIKELSEIDLSNIKISKLGKLMRIARLTSNISKFIDLSKKPKSINMKDLIVNILSSGTRDTLCNLHYETLFIGAMHFMDRFNFDIDRVNRCGVHYIVPDGRIIPFCTYNTIYRDQIEKQFSVPST